MKLWKRLKEKKALKLFRNRRFSFVEQVSDGILNFSDGNVKANSEFNENEVASVASAAKLAEEATEQVENRASEFSFP